MGGESLYGEHNGAAGTFEFHRFGDAGAILEEARHLRDILRAKNYHVVEGLQSLLRASRQRRLSP